MRIISARFRICGRAPLPGLCHALHRGGAARQADRGRHRARVPIHVVPMSGRFSVGRFELELITLTHSIPEPNAVVLRTPWGNVLHTGDWKFDPDPLIGPTADEAALRAARRREACWRWSAIRPTRCGRARSGSEAEVRRALIDLVGSMTGASRSPASPRMSRGSPRSRRPRRRTTATRRWSAGRCGGSISAARDTGYLADVPPFLHRGGGRLLPRDKIAPHLHRQPGRAARRARAHRRRRASRRSRSKRATRRSFPRASSPATSGHRPAAQPARGAWASRS